MSNSSLSFCSIIKQSGAAISSRLIPPKVFPMFLIVLIISSASELSISISIESMSANLLNKTALPSITGLDANAPRLPSPKIAEPLLITATKFPLLVYSYAASGFLAISLTGAATPGEYAKERSLLVVRGFEEIISILPDFPLI